MPDHTASESESLSADDRKRALMQAVAMAVARGARVESQTTERAVLLQPKLGGLLGRRRQIMRVDDLGNVLVEDV